MNVDTMIGECSRELTASGVEYNVDTVCECVLRKYPDEMAAHGASLARSELKRRIAHFVKRIVGADATEKYEQLRLAGFDGVPTNLLFRSAKGDMSIIGTMHARLRHVRGAIRVRDDQIAFNAARNVELRKIEDYLLQHDDDPTFGEALERSRPVLRRSSGDDARPVA